jgi:hypothetical protein
VSLSLPVNSGSYFRAGKAWKSAFHIRGNIHAWKANKLNDSNANPANTSIAELVASKIADLSPSFLDLLQYSNATDRKKNSALPTTYMCARLCPTPIGK